MLSEKNIASQGIRTTYPLHRILYTLPLYHRFTCNNDGCQQIKKKIMNLKVDDILQFGAGLESFFFITTGVYLNRFKIVIVAFTENNNRFFILNLSCAIMC
jgi:hypothetical protein